jgi:hypothetical protein
MNLPEIATYRPRKVLLSVLRDAALAVALLASACGTRAVDAGTATVDVTAKEPDRPIAKTLINRDSRFVTVAKVLNMNERAFERAQTDDIWGSANGWWQPTRQGAKYFESVSLVCNDTSPSVAS